MGAGPRRGTTPRGAKPNNHREGKPVTENERRAGDVLSLADVLLRSALVVTLILVALALVLEIRPV